jgi:hypothetical protein
MYPDLAKLLPLKWLAQAMGQGLQESLASSRFPNTAILSNIGRIPTGVFEYKGFRPSRIFGIPPYAPSSALFVGLGGFAGKLELVVTAPTAFATQDRLEQLVKEVAAGLVPRSAATTTKGATS